MSFFKFLALAAIAATTSGLRLDRERELAQQEILGKPAVLGLDRALDSANAKGVTNGLTKLPQQEILGNKVVGRDRALERANEHGIDHGLNKLPQQEIFGLPDVLGLDRALNKANAKGVTNGLTKLPQQEIDILGNKVVGRDRALERANEHGIAHGHGHGKLAQQDDDIDGPRGAGANATGLDRALNHANAKGVTNGLNKLAE
jgi:ribosome modulation factor